MWVAVAIGCLIAVLFLLTWVPLDMTVHLDIQGRMKLSLRLVWFFGLITRKIGRAGAKAEVRPAKTRRAGFRAAGRGISTFLEVLRVKGTWGQIMRLVRDVLRQVRFKHLRADMTVGLDDPADTGLLFAFIGPALVFLGPAWSKRMALRPAFGGAACQGYLHGAASLQPIRLMVPLGRFVFSPALLRAGKTMVRNRWKRKR